MNDGNFKSSLSSKLEFRLEYCWLPVTGRRDNLTGLLTCIICYNLSNNGLFILATLPFCNLTTILKLETIYNFESQRLDREMNLKERQITLVRDLGRLWKLVRQPGTRSRVIIQSKFEFLTRLFK